MLLGDGERNWGRNSLICKKGVWKEGSVVEGVKESGVVMRDKTGTRVETYGRPDTRERAWERGKGDWERENWRSAGATRIIGPVLRSRPTLGQVRHKVAPALCSPRGDEAWTH